MTGIIGELTEDVPIVHPQSLNEEIQDLFKKYPKCSGIVTCGRQNSDWTYYSDEFLSKTRDIIWL